MATTTFDTKSWKSIWKSKERLLTQQIQLLHRNGPHYWLSNRDHKSAWRKISGLVILRYSVGPIKGWSGLTSGIDQGCSFAKIRLKPGQSCHNPGRATGITTWITVSQRRNPKASPASLCVSIEHGASYLQHVTASSVVSENGQSQGAKPIENPYSNCTTKD